MKTARICALALAVILAAAAFVSCTAKETKQSFRILEENFGPEEYAIGFRSGDIALAKAVQEILDEMYSDGTATEIAKKWFGEDVILKNNDFASDMTAPENDESLDYIKNKGTFVMGLDDAYPPMTFRDSGTNEITGFDYDMAVEMCKRFGVELVVQPISWDAKDFELNSKNIDCIWSGLSVDSDRVKIYTMSKPYLENAQIILVADDSPIKAKADLAGKTVGTQKESAGYEALESDELFSQLNVNLYDDYYTAYLDLKAGRIDALVGDKTFIEYIIANEN